MFASLWRWFWNSGGSASAPPAPSPVIVRLSLAAQRTAPLGLGVVRTQRFKLGI